MDTDESYAAYVTARWTALWRLAVLLVGESRAEDVTQSALLKAYRRWSRVQESSSPDAYVKKILVNTVVSESRKRGGREPVVAVVPDLPVGSHEDTVLDRDLLWSRVVTLPPRQRAVIVLRYYEDLSEAEIARVLDCAPGTVKAHAAAALKTLRISMVVPVDAGGGSDD